MQIATGAGKIVPSSLVGHNAKSTGESSSPAGRRLLLIEDQAALRAALRKILAPEWSIIEASTGREGLSRAADVLPDAILLDLRLPDIDGETVLERLQEDETTAAIPVIVVSGRLGRSEGEIIGRGARLFLRKPFLADELRSALHSILS